ncbi:S41 family peptidase [Undibacterium sp. Tian12W]|uniref:S41 family peptidase n=1 Tax=Undibacterium sp. Tian12W TaxID=3413054 RepID=UPI003BF01C51
MKNISHRFTLTAIAALFMAASLNGVAQTQSNLPATPAAWTEAFKKDLDLAYQETLENHPGSHDPRNPDFRKNLDLARSNAMALADRVKDAAGYEAAFNRFNVSLHDGHAGAQATLPPSLAPRIRWPGFITVWRGDALYVYASETDQPAVGSRLVSCDGKPVKDLIMENVFSFKGRSDEAGHWWYFARQFMIDYGNPFIQMPKQCVFSHQNKTLTQSLAWQPVNDNFESWRARSYNGESLPTGLTEPRKNLLWVAMPSFQPNQAERETLNKMTQEITEHRDRALHADAIVIDLRENQGGSSEWSKKFAEALWGKNRVTKLMQAYSPNTDVWWRASRDNTAYMQNLITQFNSEHRADSAAWAQANASGMQAALDKGELFYVQSSSVTKDAAKTGNKALPEDTSSLKTPVYVIVPGQCASACLDALDVFTRFDNTKLIGAPSSADSTYMEVRIKPLPSGLARVVIPNKVYVNRPRAAGQIYTPAITVTDIAWSMNDFLKIVEADLVKSR